MFIHKVFLSHGPIKILCDRPKPTDTVMLSTDDSKVTCPHCLTEMANPVHMLVKYSLKMKCGKEREHHERAAMNPSKVTCSDCLKEM